MKSELFPAILHQLLQKLQNFLLFLCNLQSRKERGVLVKGGALITQTTVIVNYGIFPNLSPVASLKLKFSIITLPSLSDYRPPSSNNCSVIIKIDSQLKDKTARTFKIYQIFKKISKFSAHRSLKHKLKLL